MFKLPLTVTLAALVEGVVMETLAEEPALIAMLSPCVLVCTGELESLICTVKFVVPADAGVPEMVEPAKRSPAGSEEPEARLQV